MSNPSPFEIARATSNNLAKGFRDVRDNDALQNILSQALSTNDPQVIGKIISQVSPERQKDAINLLQNIQKNNQQKELLNYRNNQFSMPNIGNGLGQKAPQIPQNGQQESNAIPPNNQNRPQGIKKPWSDEAIAQAYATGQAPILNAMLKENDTAVNEFYRSQKNDLEREKLDIQKQVPSKDYFNDLTKAYEKSLDNSVKLRVLKDSADQILPLASARSFIQKKYDLPENFAFSDSEQAFQKLSYQLLRNTSDFYKGRILQSEIENERKSNPSLFNSPEGIRRLATLSLLQDEMTKLKFDKGHEIISKEGYVPDLQARIIKQIEPELDRIVDESIRVLKGEKGIPKAKFQGEKPPQDVVKSLVNTHGKNTEKILKELERQGYDISGS